MFTVAFMRYPKGGGDAKPFRVSTYETLTLARIAASRAGVTPDTDLAQIYTGEFTLETLPNVAEEGWWKNGIMFSTFPRK